ncbi:MAG: GDSL-type esterase/lipase family protein [Chthoniobacter sp.]|nr:GDSL-type esterase/lipase family protein [Chthoniobacter sp.]
MIPPQFRPGVRHFFVAFASLLCALVHTASAEILMKPGEKVAFLGDSITAQGWGNPAGYVKLVVAAFEANGINITPVPAGIGGHKSNDMLARLDKDVLSKKPQWMTLSCGVNDVWHGNKGVPLDDAQAAAQTYEKRSATEPDKGTYEKNITQIVEQAAAAGTKVVILTATVIKEDLGNDENKKLAPYNNFLRKLAADKHLALVDLNAMFQERIKAANQPGKNVFTVDGVHMNAEGNKIMATGVLQAFGFDAAQIKKAAAAWVPMEAQAAEEAKKVAEAKAKAAAEKAAAAKPATPVPAGK